MAIRLVDLFFVFCFFPVSNGAPATETIKETSTCSYTIVFHTPLLCKHPLLAGGAAVSAGGAGKGSGSAGAVVAAKNSVRDYLTGLAGTWVE